MTRPPRRSRCARGLLENGRNVLEVGTPPLRNDGRLHVPVMAHQMAHDFEEVCQRLFPVDEIAGRYVPAGYRLQTLADMHRRVVEARLAGDLRVVQQRRVESDVTVIRTAT